MIRPRTTTHTPAETRVRTHVLGHLHRAGPIPAAGIPARWPLTRHHIRMAVRRLTREGLLEVSRGAARGPATVGVTEAGRAAATESRRRPTHDPA